jgi:hypothetical protein
VQRGHVGGEKLDAACRSTRNGRACDAGDCHGKREGQSGQGAAPNSPFAFSTHIESPRSQVTPLKRIGEVRTEKTIERRVLTVEQPDAPALADLPATPLSHVPIGPKTGGFASPPYGGFALTVRGQLILNRAHWQRVRPPVRRLTATPAVCSFVAGALEASMRIARCRVSPLCRMIRSATARTGLAHAPGRPGRGELSPVGDLLSDFKGDDQCMGSQRQRRHFMAGPVPATLGARALLWCLGAVSGCSHQPPSYSLLIEVEITDVCIPEACAERTERVANSLAELFAARSDCTRVHVISSRVDWLQTPGAQRWSLTVTDSLAPGPHQSSWLLSGNETSHHGAGDLQQIAKDVCASAK